MPFKTPLQEAVAEVNFAAPALLEFRAGSLYELIRDQFPNYQRFPFFLVPSEAAGATAVAPYSPAYRFSSADGKKMVQYGPRMLTFNAWSYGGWPVFKDEFARIFFRAAEAGFGLVTERLALTYLNRMPVTTPQALQELLSIDLGVSDRTAPLEFLIRKVDQHERGLSNTVIAPLPPDELFTSPAFGITCTEVAYTNHEFRPENVEGDLGWFEEAHARAKDRFWNLLSKNVQDEWKETYAAQSA